MLVALMAFGLSLPWGRHQPPCPPTRYIACANSHDLARNPGFQFALREFVGGAKGAYLHGDRPLYGQVLQLIDRPAPQPVQEVGEGARLFAGCRLLSCPEKAAVILNRDGVLAIGILNYRDDSNPTLDVIVRRPDARTQVRAMVLKSWADTAVAADARNFHTRMAVKGVEIRVLDFDSAAPAPRRGWLPLIPRL